ncbi:RadC family protein [Staphylococcus canis]|uniref:DNA repair protein RadC n=1 Tax=Staphylococcus canis TaxID=2724942 RepID=A0ABS0T621_9STAP|nr:DNA repair protein RadC [Staphylococcus canis]MBI5974191.1 DNA repair protein RadC [Staphylococcus canis]
MRINDLLHEEKPKERLRLHGAKALSNTELLAILINTGRKGKSSLEIASEILKQYSNLRQLRALSIMELQNFSGIGEKKAITLLAAFELASRIYFDRQVLLSEPIKGPEQIAEYMYHDLKGIDQEHFIVLILNTKHHIVHKETLFIGTLNSAIIHPREVFKVALKWSAHAIIVVHNHPSGDTTPSSADITTTKRLITCGEAMGIELLDHIIVGEDNFTSIMSETQFK